MQFSSRALPCHALHSMELYVTALFLSFPYVCPEPGLVK